MKTRRLAILTLSSALVTLVLVAPGAGAVPKSADAAAGRSGGGDLYLLGADGGTISGSKLVLRGVEPSATSFTDRPRRSAGSVATPRLAARWSSIFGTIAPNAALEVQGAPKSADVALLELRAPHYDPATRTLTFKIHRLNHTGDPALKEFDQRADGGAVKEFKAASLFVDSGGEPEVPVTVRAYTAGNGPISVEFSGGIQYFGGVTGIKTPVVQGNTSTGEISIADLKLITFNAAAEGGGMNANVFVEVYPTDGHLVGNASLVNGGTIELIIGEEPPVKLAEGAFDLAVP
jgi:hypothetical protein